MPTNFRFPYLSTNPSEFWRRWHISLSSWLRDYLYIPLGGSWGSRGRTLFALMVTMALGGLWHGAHVNMLIWGTGHGLLLILYRLAEPITPTLRRLPMYRLWAGLLWYVSVTDHGS